VLISVVITNYNYGRFLGQAVESVLSQTHDAVECIVVDDGSTDNSREVLARYPAVRAIFKENGGQAKALQTGVDAAKGEVVISLDADDWLLEQACARIAAAWRPDLACINYRLSLNGDPTRLWPEKPFLDQGRHIAFFAANGYYPTAPMSGNAFSRLFVQEFLGFADHLDGDGVDTYLLFAAPFFGGIAHIDEALGVYRTHGSNVSMASGKMTVKNLGDHAYYHYWGQQNAQRYARHKGVDFPQRSYLVGSYTSLWMLLARDAGYDRLALPDQGRLLTIAVTIRGFLQCPDLSPARRMKNILLLMAFAVLPLPARRAIGQRLFFS